MENRVGDHSLYMETPSVEQIEILTRNTEWVRALARQLVGDPHLAEDVAQDAAVAALSAAPPRQGQAWLRGIVRNLAANLRRRTARRTRSEARASKPEHQPSTVEGVSFLEQQRLLAGAVLALDEPYREVVLLRFYEGLAQRHIARRLGLPKTTVSSRLSRALATLRSDLDRRHNGNRQAWVSALAPIALPVVDTAGITLGMKKACIGLAAAFLIAVPLVWGWYGPPTDPLPPQQTGSGIPSVLGEVATEQPVPQPGTGTRTRITPPEIESGRTLAIQVVDGETGRPVPSATVRLMDPTSQPSPEVKRVQRRVMLRLAALREMFERGQLLPLDETATLHVPYQPPSASYAFYAIHDDRIGTLRILSSRPAENTNRLELWPIHRIPVRVADALGRPVAGVPVALRLAQAGRPSTTGSFAHVADTGPDGFAELQWSLALADDEWDKEDVQPEVRLELPMVESVSQRVSATDPEVVTLVLPPSGEVRVFPTLRGHPLPENISVVLSTPDNPKDPLQLPFTETRVRWIEETQGSVARFGPVGLGPDFRIRVQVHPETSSFELTAGPLTEPNQVLDVRFDMDAELIEVSGHILGEDGGAAPVPEWYARILADGEDRDYARTKRIVLDSTGSFRELFAVETNRPGLRLEMTDFPTGRQWWIETPFPEAEDGVVDLGDLHAMGEVPLVSGTVVDESGTPVPGVTVRQVEPGWNTSADWLPVSGFRTEPTDAEGRFSLWGDAPKGEVWLQVWQADTWHHDPVLWNRESTEIRLVLQEAGEIRGRLLLPPGVPATELGVEVWFQNGPGPTFLLEERGTPRELRGWVIGRVSKDGSFEVPSLKPESYTLAVLMPGRRDLRELFRLDDIRVQPGHDSDPRLAAIDLRSMVYAVDLRVRDEEGNPIPAQARAYLNEAQKVRDIHILDSTDSPFLLSTSDVLRRILVYADGYFPVTIEPVGNQHEIVLSRGIPVTMRVPGAPALEPPFAL